MSLIPARIFHDIKKKNLNVKQGIYLLKSFIENSRDPELRLSGLAYLKRLNIKNKSIFSLLENLLISDTDEKVRVYAANFLSSKYREKAISPISWAMKYEENYFCQISIIKNLARINNVEAEHILIKEIQKICSKDYIDSQNLYHNFSFIKSIKNAYGFHWNSIPTADIADILINFKTISNLIQEFYYVFFEWEQGRVISLDLSELGWNVSRAWNFTYANRLQDLKEIPGIFNLKNLRVLDLSNNRLKSIKELLKFRNLTHLYLKNNKLEDPENIMYLRDMKKLEHVDVRGNKIANYINKSEFSNLNLILKDYLVFM